jgi:hypothetical protein
MPLPPFTNTSFSHRKGKLMKKILILVVLSLASGMAFAQAHTFEDLDTDKNGSLSKEEAAAMEGLDFDKADTNKDGALSKEEHDAAMGGAEAEKPAG